MIFCWTSNLAPVAIRKVSDVDKFNFDFTLMPMKIIINLWSIDVKDCGSSIVHNIFSSMFAIRGEILSKYVVRLL